VVCAGIGFLLFSCSTGVQRMDDHGGGQNTAIKGQILVEKAKNLTKHIKQLHPSINREYESK